MFPDLAHGDVSGASGGAAIIRAMHAISRGRVRVRLAQIFESIAWAALALGYTRWCFDHSLDFTDFAFVGRFLLWPYVFCGCCGAAIGCLLSRRWQGAVLAIVIGSLPCFLLLIAYLA
ncbi:MAG TPA: hypothetical protein VHY20_07850 [Pirellulales bacterium]|jgi:hypothetical protein|nr:hypothetical protein [Pirellulales bacterium]